MCRLEGNYLVDRLHSAAKSRVYGALRSVWVSFFVGVVHEKTHPNISTGPHAGQSEGENDFYNVLPGLLMSLLCMGRTKGVRPVPTDRN